MLRRCAPLFIALAMSSALLPLAGCKGGANPFATLDPRAAAMAALSEQIKTAAKGYLQGLNGVVATVAEAKDFSTAMTALEKLRPYYDDVRTYAPELQRLTGADLDSKAGTAERVGDAGVEPDVLGAEARGRGELEVEVDAGEQGGSCRGEK